MKKRLFFSIPISDEIRDRLASLDNPEYKINWVDPSLFHLTLIFLGELDEDLIEKISSAAGSVSQNFSPFSLSFEKITFAPPGDAQPRMIWAVFQNNNQFSDLRTSLADKLTELGLYSGNQKDVIPHITIARAKSLENISLMRIKNLPELKIDKIELLESRLSNNGSEYQLINSFMLNR